MTDGDPADESKYVDLGELFRERKATEASAAAVRDEIVRRAAVERAALERRRCAPVLIAWSSPDEPPDLVGDVLGFPGSQSVWSPTENRLVNVTDVVMFDGLEMQHWPKAQTDALPGVMRHELGHLVGSDTQRPR